jgi:hypothetical protein
MILVRTDHPSLRVGLYTPPPPEPIVLDLPPPACWWNSFTCPRLRWAARLATAPAYDEYHSPILGREELRPWAEEHDLARSSIAAAKPRDPPTASEPADATQPPLSRLLGTYRRVALVLGRTLYTSLARTPPMDTTSHLGLSPLDATSRPPRAHVRYSSSLLDARRPPLPALFCLQWMCYVNVC